MARHKELDEVAGTKPYQYTATPDTMQVVTGDEHLSCAGRHGVQGWIRFESNTCTER